MVTFVRIKFRFVTIYAAGGFLSSSAKAAWPCTLFFVCPAFVWGNANANAHSLIPLAALTFDLVQAKLAARNVAAQAAAAFA